MDKELIEELKVFGLSDYESKAYSAVVSTGTASVTEISQLCDVPRSNLYGVLESLSEKGFVDIQQGRPILFKARDPKRVFNELEKNSIDKIKKAKDNALKKVTKLSAEKKADIEPALIWGVRGVSSVLRKISEIIKRSKKEVLINIPELSIFSKETKEALSEAKKRGVKIRIVCQPSKEVKEFRKFAIVRTREKIHGIDIISDDKEVLVAPTFPIAAAWVDNPEMTLHVKDFLILVWKDAKVLK